MEKKVLLVEDTVTDAAIIIDLLEAEGIEVTLANRGEEGIKKAIACKPDLVILDLVLPDMSGYDVCARIKSEMSLVKTIVVILTIKGDREDIVKAFNFGADDYIIKPPEPEFLARKIKLYLGMHH